MGRTYCDHAMNQNSTHLSSVRNALIMGATIVALLDSVYTMRQDVFAMLIPPATAATLLYVQIITSRLRLLRTTGAILAMAIFNAIIMFGDSMGLQGWLSGIHAAPDLMNTARVLPTLLVLLSNAAVVCAWMTTRHTD